VFHVSKLNYTPLHSLVCCLGTLGCDPNLIDPPTTGGHEKEESDHNRVDHNCCDTASKVDHPAEECDQKGHQQRHQYMRHLSHLGEDVGRFAAFSFSFVLVPSGNRTEQAKRKGQTVRSECVGDSCSVGCLHHQLILRTLLIHSSTEMFDERSRRRKRKSERTDVLHIESNKQE